MSQQIAGQRSRSQHLLDKERAASMHKILGEQVEVSELVSVILMKCLSRAFDSERERSWILPDHED